MARYNAEQANNNLDELRALLRPWYANRASDSVTIQAHRSHEYEAGKRLIGGLIHGVQPEQRLRLMVGTTAVEGFRFRKGSDGRNDTALRTMLDPGDELELRTDRLAIDPIKQAAELYVGFVVKIALSEVARTLTEGGELSIIGSSPATN